MGGHLNNSMLIAASVCIAAVSAPVFGQVYQWTDQKGKVHYSDKPPGETSVIKPDWNTGVAARSQVPPAALSGQNIAGLRMEYPNSFQASAAKAQQWLSNAPANAKKLTRSFELFEAQPTNELGEISVAKIRYVREIQPNIDGATSESMQYIARLDGIQKFKQSIKSLNVSGHEARQASFEAERYGGKLGGEFLIILDRRTNTLWQIQLLFGRKRGINPFVSSTLDNERLFATSLLRTVTVLE